MDGRITNTEKKKPAEPPLDVPARGAFLTPVSMVHVTDASSGRASPMPAKPMPPTATQALQKSRDGSREGPSEAPRKWRDARDGPPLSSSELSSVFVMGSVNGLVGQAGGGHAGNAVRAPPPPSPTPPSTKVPRRPESARPSVRPHSAMMSHRGGAGGGAAREKTGGMAVVEELSSLQQAIHLLHSQHLPAAPVKGTEPRHDGHAPATAGVTSQAENKASTRKPRVWSAGGELWGEGGKRHASPAGISRTRPRSGTLATRAWDPVAGAASNQGGPTAAWTNAQALPVAALLPLQDTGLLLDAAEMREAGFSLPAVERLQRLIYVHAVGFHRSVDELCAGSADRRRALPRICHTFLAVWRHHLGVSFPDDIAQLAAERDVATTEYMSLKAKMAAMEHGMERLVKESLARLLEERDDSKEKEAQWQQREADARQMQEQLRALEAAKAKAETDNETLSLMLAHADSKEWPEERRLLREELVRALGDAARATEELRRALSVAENSCQKLQNEMQGLRSELASALASRDEARALADASRHALEERSAQHTKAEEEMKDKIKHMMWAQALNAGKMEGMKQELASKLQDQHEVTVLKDQVRRLEYALSTAAKEGEDADVRLVALMDKLALGRKKKQHWREQAHALEQRVALLQEAQQQEMDRLRERLLRQVQDADAEVAALRTKLDTFDQLKQTETAELRRRHEELIATLNAQWKEELRAAEHARAREAEELRSQLSQQGNQAPSAPRGEAAYNTALQQEVDALRSRLAYMSKTVTDAMAKEDAATSALLERTKEARQLAALLEAARMEIVQLASASAHDELKLVKEQAKKREEGEREARRQLEDRLRETEAAAAEQAHIVQDLGEKLGVTRSKLLEVEQQAGAYRSKLDVATGRTSVLEHASLRMSEVESQLARERERSAALTAQVKLLTTSTEQLQLSTQAQLSEKQRAVEAANQQRARAEQALEALKETSALALLAHDTAERELKHFARALIEDTCAIEAALRTRVAATSKTNAAGESTTTGGRGIDNSSTPLQGWPAAPPLQGVTWVQLMVVRGAIDILSKARPWERECGREAQHHGRPTLGGAKQGSSMTLSLSPPSDLWTDLEGKLLANAAAKMEWVAVELMAQLRADVERIVRAIADKLDELQARGADLMRSADERLRRLPAMVASLSTLASRNRAIQYQLVTIRELYDKKLLAEAAWHRERAALLAELQESERKVLKGQHMLNVKQGECAREMAAMTANVERLELEVEAARATRRKAEAEGASLRAQLASATATSPSQAVERPGSLLPAEPGRPQGGHTMAPLGLKPDGPPASLQLRKQGSPPLSPLASSGQPSPMRVTFGSRESLRREEPPSNHGVSLDAARAVVVQLPGDAGAEHPPQTATSPLDTRAGDAA